MATITYDRVGKTYHNGVNAVLDMSLSVADGEFMVLVGPSGCGKSTTLRMGAGLEAITQGEIRIDSDIVNNLSPRERDIAMVFQNHALYPHMTVRENMSFVLLVQKLSDGEIRRRVLQAAELLEITPFLDRRPATLSGGQCQRVAMGRAIVRQPKVFLMDEPLSDLDAALRVQTRAEISALQRQLGVTTIYVTHDQAEALTMGDRVAVMQAGRLMQCAPPQELYDLPANLFVAGFIGSPKMNILRATLHRQPGGDIHLRFGGDRLILDAQIVRSRPALRSRPNGPITVGLRPEAFSAARESSPLNTIEVETVGVEMLGSETLIHFVAPQEIGAYNQELDPFRYIERQTSPIARFGAHLLCARLIPPIRLRVGSSLRLSIDPRRLYFFDDNGDILV
jgi:multiple sugar transport system ATP-binding protein